MPVGIAAERRLLSENEYGRIRQSHYPELGELDAGETLELARWLRAERNRVRDIITARRRARRGKGAGGGVTAAESSERGLSAKKQVFSRALKRVNARLDRHHSEHRRATARAHLIAAVERKQKAPRGYPDPGRTAGKGMRPITSKRPTVEANPAEIGRVSQFVKDAQAKRDG